MASTGLQNRDHALVKIAVRHDSGISNITLKRKERDKVDGPDGDNFTLAWKVADELISAEELDRFGASYSYGADITFGTPKGRVP